jgi:uncharacterized phage infection (PIP) family protein YhgE
MAINIPIVTSLEDKGIKAAKAAFQNFQTSVGEAQGGLNKFKAGSKSVMDSVAANAGTFAIAGGIAFAKFAFDGVKAFQDLALGAEKFATSTGLSLEEASRYIEAAGDIAVPVDAVEGAIGRLNKTIGADPDKVRDLGVDLVYLADGSLDVNETFLNTIDRIKGIKDPAEKAKVAAQLLGKGWQSMSTLIEMGADDLKKSLDGVSEAKVVNPEELAKAKELRDIMDTLKDKVEDLSLSIGGSLVPVLGDLGAVLDVGLDVRNVFKSIPGATWMSENLTPLGLTKNALGGVKDAAGFVFNLFTDEKEVIPVFAEDLRNARADTDTLKESIKQARNPLKQLGDEATNTSVAFVNASTAWETLTKGLDEEVALDDAKIKLGELEAAAKLAFGTGAQADLDAYEAQAAEFATMLATISTNMGNISANEILIRYKTQGPAAALELAGYLARGAEYGGISQMDALTLAGISTLPARANGGPVMGGSSYLVGERGAEIFTPSSSGNITPNGAMGGNTITVNVNGGDPNQVVAALQRWVRDNGSVPLAATTAIRR